jgi:hypothetical protein
MGAVMGPGRRCAARERRAGSLGAGTSINATAGLRIVLTHGAMRTYNLSARTRLTILFSLVWTDGTPR